MVSLGAAIPVDSFRGLAECQLQLGWPFDTPCNVSCGDGLVANDDFFCDSRTDDWRLSTDADEASLCYRSCVLDQDPFLNSLRSVFPVPPNWRVTS